MTRLERHYAGKPVLILGGLGFLGLNLARFLVNLGSVVTVADLVLGEGIIEAAGIAGQVETCLVDICNKEAVQKVVQGKDIIFSLVGKSGATESLVAPLTDLAVNCQGQLTVLEACRRHNPQAVIVFPSSRLVYGRMAKISVSEEEMVKPPINIYAIHKLTGEMYHRLFWQIYGLRTVVLRISNPYGPWQFQVGGKYGVCNWFIYLATRGSSIPIYGSGEQIRDYVFISNVVNAFLECAACDKAYGQTFNVGSGEGIRLVDFAHTVVDIVGQGRIEHIPWPEVEKKIETGDFVSDISKLRRIVGWEPTNRLRENIENIAHFYNTVPVSLLREV